MCLCASVLNTLRHGIWFTPNNILPEIPTVFCNANANSHEIPIKSLVLQICRDFGFENSVTKLANGCILREYKSFFPPQPRPSYVTHIVPFFSVLAGNKYLFEPFNILFWALFKFNLLFPSSNHKNSKTPPVQTLYLLQDNAELNNNYSRAIPPTNVSL